MSRSFPAADGAVVVVGAVVALRSSAGGAVVRVSPEQPVARIPRVHRTIAARLADEGTGVSFRFRGAYTTPASALMFAPIEAPWPAGCDMVSGQDDSFSAWRSMCLSSWIRSLIQYPSTPPAPPAVIQSMGSARANSWTLIQTLGPTRPLDAIASM